MPLICLLQLALPPFKGGREKYAETSEAVSFMDVGCPTIGGGDVVSTTVVNGL